MPYTYERIGANYKAPYEKGMAIRIVSGNDTIAVLTHSALWEHTESRAVKMVNVLNAVDYVPLDDREVIE